MMLQQFSEKFLVSELVLLLYMQVNISSSQQPG